MLENILEEIEEAARQEDAPIYCGDVEVDRFVRESVVTDIISKHMNDGWIPCEERMPEKSGHYLVQLSEKMSSEDYSDMTVVLYEEEFEEFLSYSSWILAWQPLPEPYRPEKGEETC